MSCLHRFRFSSVMRACLIVAVAGGLSVPAASGERLLYKDPSQSVEARVKDLVARMTLEEKVAQMTQVPMSALAVGNDGDVTREALEDLFQGMSPGTLESPFIDATRVSRISEAVDRYLRESTRLGVPALQIAEGLHGYLALETTIFPQAIAQGSTWNRDLIREMSSAVAREASLAGVDQMLSPILDVSRDPRWGRIEETYGEDPYLVAEMGMAYVIGLQGVPEATRHGIPDGKLLATAKHFAAYSVPFGGINLGPVSIGPRELRETHLYSFRKAVQEANIYAVMPSYNELNGVPLHANSFMLQDVLRDELGFVGYTFSDYTAIRMLQENQKVADSAQAAGRMALESGVDLEAPNPYGYADLVEMVESGDVSEDLVDHAVSRILTAKFKGGLFERPYKAPVDIRELIHTQEHVDLARRIADESIILLKNEGDLLPLDRLSLESIAVIGPNADRVQYGDYSATKHRSSGVTLLQGIQNAVGDDVEVMHAEGVGLTSLDTSKIAAAVEAAEESDVVVLAIGGTHLVLGGVGWQGEISRYPIDDPKLDPPTGGEGYDRTSLTPPGVQPELIRALHKTGKPIILVMIHGRPYSIGWEKENLPAILEAWYPGEQGGNAIAGVLFGDVNPSGKLTVSVPRSVGHIPVFYNRKPTHRGYYRNRGTKEQPGRDYVFSSPDPLFPFGFGLSYTSYEYSELRLGKTSYSVEDKAIQITLVVTNTGNRAGMETVQLYFNDRISSVATPVMSLKGFEKVELQRGERRKVSFELPIQELGLWDRSMEYVVEPGEFEIMIGASSEDIRLRKTITISR